MKDGRMDGWMDGYCVLKCTDGMGCEEARVAMRKILQNK